MKLATFGEAAAWVKRTLENLDNIIVVGIRHGKKEGDALTAKGVEQATASYALLDRLGLMPQRVVIYSGANRTRQMAEMVNNHRFVLGVVDLKAEPLFHFQPVADELFPGNAQAVLDEIPGIKEAGGTVAAALERSEYARRVRERVAEGVLTMATEMWEWAESTGGLFCSHSPCVECAAANPAEQAYAIGEADMVLYVVRRGESSGLEIVDSAHLPCPIGGATN